MKKYGLQLRVQPQQKKQQTRPPIPNPLSFNDDDDDDNVEREIMRQAHKNKTHKDVEEQHKKALEEDPSAFDYDDKMEENIRPVDLDRQDRKPRYIKALMDKAKQREKEHEISYERKIAKERSKDKHLYADKDKYVASAYKKKLAEQAKWMEEERLHELREKEDVTKKADLSDFYFNLAKNVAFGAGDADLRKPEKQPEAVAVQSPEKDSPSATDTSLESPIPDKTHEDDDAHSLSPTGKSAQSDAKPKPVSDGTLQDQAINEPRLDHHKRSEDAIAAAKARFLARKKPKV